MSSLRASSIGLSIVGGFTVLLTEPFSVDTLTCRCVMDVWGFPAGLKSGLDSLDGCLTQQAHEMDAIQ